MRSQKTNPQDVYISTDRDVVQRSILFRNTSGKDFILKLVASHPDAITFPTTVFRFPPASFRTIQFRVDSRKIGSWDRARMSIRGYVVPVYSRNLRQWIDRKNTAECKSQEAFSLAVQFTESFSAPQTVVNLPGNSDCIDSADHPVDVEELDTRTAINIERDVVTAEPFGSMMSYVEEFKRKEAKKGCWLTELVCGKADEENLKGEKSARSRASSKSCRQKRRRSGQVNLCLEATPCGGSTVQA